MMGGGTFDGALPESYDRTIVQRGSQPGSTAAAHFADLEWGLSPAEAAARLQRRGSRRAPLPSFPHHAAGKFFEHEARILPGFLDGELVWVSIDLVKHRRESARDLFTELADILSRKYGECTYSGSCPKRGIVPKQGTPRSGFTSIKRRGVVSPSSTSRPKSTIA